MTGAEEAHALFRAAVEEPADEVARLVFADWLDDAGTADAAAWAHFIRLGTVAHTGAMPPRERADRRTVAARDVTAKRTVPFAEFAAQAAGLLQLLPAGNITVGLAAAAVPLPVVAQVWEPVARRHPLLPVAWSGWHPEAAGPSWTERTLIVATPNPARLRAAIDRDEEDFGRAAVHCVRAVPGELAAALDRSYARLREETAVRTLLLGFPPGWVVNNAGPFGTLDGPPIVRLVGGILTEAINRRVGLIRMTPDPLGRRVSMRDRQGWREWNTIPDWLQADVVAYLREMAGLPGEQRPFETGLIRFEHRDQPYEFLLEVTDTPAGADVTIHATG